MITVLGNLRARKLISTDRAVGTRAPVALIRWHDEHETLALPKCKIKQVQIITVEAYLMVDILIVCSSTTYSEEIMNLKNSQKNLSQASKIYTKNCGTSFKPPLTFTVGSFIVGTVSRLENSNCFRAFDNFDLSFR